MLVDPATIRRVEERAGSGLAGGPGREELRMMTQNDGGLDAEHRERVDAAVGAARAALQASRIGRDRRLRTRVDRRVQALHPVGHGVRNIDHVRRVPRRARLCHADPRGYAVP